MVSCRSCRRNVVECADEDGPLALGEAAAEFGLGGGNRGIVYLGNPNEFGNPVYLQKVNCEKVLFPLTHGFAENSRGLGAAEMAWSIRAGRPNRACKEMAFHVFEMMHGVMLSAERGEVYRLESTFETPKALPAGYIGDGDWTRKEESALI